MLLELGPDAYAVLLPLVDGTMRATLIGDGDDGLVAQVQSGCPDVKAQRVASVMYVGVGSSPYDLLKTSFEAVRAQRVSNWIDHSPPPSHRAPRTSFEAVRAQRDSNWMDHSPPSSVVAAPEL